MKSLTTILAILLTSVTLSAQSNDKLGVGAGLVHNLQVRSFGSNVMLHIPLSKHLNTNVFFSYFSASNQIHEYYWGADIQYKYVIAGNLALYGLAGLSYNKWLNHNDYNNALAKPQNMSIVLGPGAKYSLKWLSFFVEHRYNIIWQEATLRAGIILSPNLKNQQHKRGNFKSSAMMTVLCPKFK